MIDYKRNKTARILILLALLIMVSCQQSKPEKSEKATAEKQIVAKPTVVKEVRIDTGAGSPILNEKIYRGQLGGRDIELGWGYSYAGGYKHNSIFYKYDDKEEWINLSDVSKVGKRSYLLVDAADSSYWHIEKFNNKIVGKKLKNNFWVSDIDLRRQWKQKNNIKRK